MTQYFPVVASILSPEALIKKVLPGYGLMKVLKCQFYSGGFNHTYRIKTEDGRTFFLRAYRRGWRTLGDILYELDVLNHLKRKGFPAAQPILYQDGNYYSSIQAPEGERYLALFSGAPGQEISHTAETENMARRYGQAEAQMHNALDDFCSTHARFQLDIPYFTEQSLQFLEPFLTHRPADWVFILQFAEILRERLVNLPATELELGVCHGDLQGYHAMLDSDGVLTFFDFDCGGFGYRAYDLAVFLWCCRLQEAVGTRWLPFLKAYQETRFIRELDLQAVPLFVCARYLWHMGVHAQNSPDWGIDFLNDEYYDTHLKRLRDAEADYLKSQ